MVGSLLMGRADQSAVGGRAAISTLFSHALGGAAGGAMAGAVVALPGQTAGIAIHPIESATLLLVVSLLFSLAQAEFIRMPFPQMRRQVPNRWRWHMGQKRVALAYGLLLGTGVFTHITSGALYAVLGWCATNGDIRASSAVMAVFGASRTVPLAALSRVRTNEALDDATCGLIATSGAARLMEAVGLAGVAGYALHTAVVR